MFVVTSPATGSQELSQGSAEPCFSMAEQREGLPSFAESSMQHHCFPENRVQIFKQKIQIVSNRKKGRA
jgi:hypothetical protein